MELINTAVYGSNYESPQQDVPQLLGRSEQKECDKMGQAIGLNTEFDKKIDESLKNSKSLDCRDIKTGTVPSKNGESCNELETNINKLTLVDKKKLKNENTELKKSIYDLEKCIVSLKDQISQKDKKISELEGKITALKVKIVRFESILFEQDDGVFYSYYNMLPGIKAILCYKEKFDNDGSLKKNAVNEMKSLIGEEMGYKDDGLKELTTRISRILKNELLIDGLDSNFDSNGNLKKEAVSTIKAIVNKVYPDDKID